MAVTNNQHIAICFMLAYLFMDQSGIFEMKMFALIIGAGLFVMTMMNLEKLGRRPLSGVGIMLMALGLLLYGLV